LTRNDFNQVVHIENSEHEKRSWHYLHADPETILLGNWYRPGATIHDGYMHLISEIEMHSAESTGIILSGDLNIHHARWLRHSNGNSIQGADLKALCDNLGLQQLVGEPTRQQYLLDLYLSDVAGTKVKVGPYIADHKLIIASVPFPEVTTLHIRRQRFNLLRARWAALKDALSIIDWAVLHRGTAEDAATLFMEILWMNLCTYIPYEEINVKKKSHPWLNTACESAITAKNDAEHTPNFDSARSECTRVLKEEQDKYVVKLRAKINSLSKGSKEWWSLNKFLLSKRTKCSSIQPLRDGPK